MKKINKEFKCFDAIRSSGLWIGCKLNVTEDFNLDTVMKACYAKGLMILKANNNTIRIAPSLIIEDDIILRGLEILREGYSGTDSLDFGISSSIILPLYPVGRTRPRFALEEIYSSRSFKVHVLPPVLPS